MESKLFRLLQMHNDKPKGNLLFNTLADAETWFEWARLEIVKRHHNLTTGWHEYTVKGKGGKEFLFNLRPVVIATDDEAAA
jgi:hypothetical protein